MIHILDPITCGFTKTFAYELFTQDFGIEKNGSQKQWLGRVNKTRYDKFIERYFEFSEANNSYKIFTNKHKKIVDHIKSLGKKDVFCKNLFLTTFSSKSWNDLDPKDQNKHTPNNCQACLDNHIYKDLLSTLPRKNNTYKRKAFLNDFKGERLLF